MLSWIREKFGKVVIGGIISSIALVFIFYGVFSPKSTRGLHEGSAAGTVNGDSISISEFNGALNQRIELFKKMAGGKLTEEQIKSFRLRDGVFEELVTRKLLIQEARKLGVGASDEEIKTRIREMPVFQKDGKFDLDAYKQVLEANRYSPSSFERLMREDLSVQQWESYFSRRSHVSEKEVEKEFQLTQEKRKLKYVVFTPETAKKKMVISADEVKKFLEDAAKKNLVKLRFDAGKETLYKGQTLETVQEGIARSILSGEKRDEIQKINSALADQVLAAVTGPHPDAAVEKLIKPLGIKLQQTEWLTRANARLPELGEAKELIGDAFGVKSPIDLRQGGKAKKYSFLGKTVVGWLEDSQNADMSRFAAERETLLQQLQAKKARALFENWFTKVKAKASIDKNTSVVGGPGVETGDQSDVD